MNNTDLHTNSFIKIGIGNDTKQFHIMTTDAPKEYDGFGAFCVGEFKSERTVLIRVEHFAWQQKRYQSGNHYMQHLTSAMKLSKSFYDHVSRDERHGK